MDTRVVVALFLVLLGGGVAVVGALPQAHLTPREAVLLPEGAHEATIKGTIARYDGNGTGPFQVTDGDQVLDVLWSQPYPENFGIGRTVAIHGTLHILNGAVWMDGHRIEVGCPSKYQTSTS